MRLDCRHWTVVARVFSFVEDSASPTLGDSGTATCRQCRPAAVEHTTPIIIRRQTMPSLAENCSLAEKENDMQAPHAELNASQKREVMDGRGDGTMRRRWDVGFFRWMDGRRCVGGSMRDGRWDVLEGRGSTRVTRAETDFSARRSTEPRRHCHRKKVSTMTLFSRE